MQIRELKEKTIAVVIAAIIMAASNMYAHSTTAVWYISGGVDYSNVAPKTQKDVEPQVSYVPNLIYQCKYVPSASLC